MATLASMTILSSGTYSTGIAGAFFSFAVAEMDPAGAVPDQLVEQQEELIDPGVNGTRYRRVYKQFAKFFLNTIADASSYSTGISTVAQYWQAKGQLCNLSITQDGTSRTWKNVKILDVVPQLRKGILLGNGASAGSACVLYAKWQLVLGDVTKTGSSN